MRFLILTAAIFAFMPRAAGAEEAQPIWLECSIAEAPKSNDRKPETLTLIWRPAITEIDVYTDGHAVQASRTSAGEPNIVADFWPGGGDSAAGIGWSVVIDRRTLEIGYYEKHTLQGEGTCKVIPPKPLPKRQI